jgi:hypothetical protein
MTTRKASVDSMAWGSVVIAFQADIYEKKVNETQN